ncbi:hypothetical protein BC829DRAFT_430941 [Chytridium lagenaria]|nr:hypothetical protein BC829DRAFT_430941 [Chytridium lagenaria]
MVQVKNIQKLVKSQKLKSHNREYGERNELHKTTRKEKPTKILDTIHTHHLHPKLWFHPLPPPSSSRTPPTPNNVHKPHTSQAVPSDATPFLPSVHAQRHDHIDASTTIDASDVDGKGGDVSMEDEEGEFVGQRRQRQACFGRVWEVEGVHDGGEEEGCGGGRVEEEERVREVGSVRRESSHALALG